MWARGSVARSGIAFATRALRALPVLLVESRARVRACVATPPFRPAAGKAEEKRPPCIAYVRCFPNWGSLQRAWNWCTACVAERARSQ